MKKLFVFIFIISFDQSYGQDLRAIESGITALPLYDVFHFFPENKIKGIALSANLGCWTHRRISIGINPYLATVKNLYVNKYSVEEDLKFYGLNTYLRFRYFERPKLNYFWFTSLGFGNLQKSILINPGSFTISRSEQHAVFNFLSGIGLNYFITKPVALEINIPFLYSLFLSGNSRDKTSFYTIAPSIGLQFYFGRKTNENEQHSINKHKQGS